MFGQPNMNTFDTFIYTHLNTNIMGRGRKKMTDAEREERAQSSLFKIKELLKELSYSELLTVIEVASKLKESVKEQEKKRLENEIEELKKQLESM